MSVIIPEDDLPPSYRPVLLTALATILFLVIAFGGWGLFARLDGAVVTQGVVLAKSKRKTVENLEGGILASLLVRPGDRVVAGQPVARLDTTQERERLTQMEAERLSLVFDIWRLEAEASGAAPDPAAPPSPDGTRARAALALFSARLGLHEGQTASFDRQAELFAAQVRANRAQAEAAATQIASWTEELADTETLVARGASPRHKLRELQRNIAVLRGEADEYAALAAAADRQGERVAADRTTLGRQRVADAAERLAEARRALPGLEAQMRATEDVLARRTLRAPQDGLVVDILVVTPGAVIASGAVVMEIVPDSDTLIIQTRLPPEAIDTVHVGRTAKLRLTAYRRAVAPTVSGVVNYVSADLLADPRDGTPYFEAQVTLDPGALDALPGIALSAGMPVEVAIRTGERRAGDYLLEPFLRHINRAMRDE